MAAKDNEGDSGNGRVTMAILATKLDATIERLGRIEDKIDCLPGQKVQIEHLEDRLDKMEAKSNRWDLVNSIGVGVGTVIGALFGQRS